MWMGYRTRMSMLNKDVWHEAQQYSGKTALKIGIAECLIGILFLTFTRELKDQVYFWVDIALALILMFMIVVFTEIHLNALFYKNGERKNKL